MRREWAREGCRFCKLPIRPSLAGGGLTACRAGRTGSRAANSKKMNHELTPPVDWTSAKLAGVIYARGPKTPLALGAVQGGANRAVSLAVPE